MTAELRIGDAEREAAIRALGEHYAAGRLTKEEYDERAEVAWSARTEAALRPLFVDLPGPRVGRPASAVPAPRPSSMRPPVPHRRPRSPWLVVLLILLVALVLTAAPWPLLALAVALWWFGRSHRACRRW